MHTGVVQHIPALRHTQESGALLERLGSELGHLQQLFSRGERAVLLAVRNDILCGHCRQSRNIAQQRRRRRVDIHADTVDAVLNHTAECFVQPLLRHIVLVLSNTDRLRVDLDQLGKRVLQAARDGDRRAQIDIVLRELLRRELGCRVDRRARLVDHHIGHMLSRRAAFADQIHRHRLGLPARGAVADREMLNPVLQDTALELFDALLPLALAKSRVDHHRIQHLAGPVDHGDLASVRIARVESHDHLAAHRRLHEQRTQVEREIVNRSLRGVLGQLGADFPFERREQQTVPAVLRRLHHEFPAGGSPAHHVPPDRRERTLRVRPDGYLEESLLLAAVDCEHLMSLQTPHRLREVVVQPVDRVLLTGRRHGHLCGLLQLLTQVTADLRVVRDHLRQNVGCTGERVRYRRHLIREKSLCELVRICRRHLKQNLHRERLQSLFLRNRRACPPLLFVRTVQILHRRERLRPVNRL